MAEPFASILLLPPDEYLAGLKLDPERLAAAAGGLAGVSEVRRVRAWQAEAAGPLEAEARLVLVGRREPLPLPDTILQFPVDLETCMPWLDGPAETRALALVRAAAAEASLSGPVLSRVFEPVRRVLVWGDGPAAGSMVERLSRAGFPVFLARPIPDGNSSESPAEVPPEVEILDEATWLALDGFAGRFSALLDAGGRTRNIEAGAVVLCGRPCLEPAPTGFDFDTPVTSLSGFEADPKIEPGSRLVFLSGPGRAATSAGMGRLMKAAIEAGNRTGAAVFLLAPEIKVAGPGLERLYAEARQAGVSFVRVPASGPEPERLGDGRVRFAVYDPLARARLLLTPDRIVLDETLRPDEALEGLAARIGLMLGPDGFAAPDNVLFLSEATNRTGLLAIGPARGTDSADGLDREIGAALDEIQRLLAPGRKVTDPIRVDIGRCAACLCCIRSCPVQALGFTHRPWPDPVACARCGLCAAECPSDALQLEGCSDDQVKARLAALMDRPRTGPDFTPRLVLFGCRRSALPALAAAPRPRSPMDLVFIPLPCAGRIEDDLILTALVKGADGVMVAACHTDNCRTQQGGPKARQRIERVGRLLAEAGLEPGRLLFFTLAPNMGAELAGRTAEFSRAVTEMGPHPFSRNREAS
ncbi:MAG: hydrogenase iron-sulfur subunit [Proteobacteria bacterium]|nr:hydrogenase iron-sulfur subunit [Pseudomonadota bacterium]